MRVFISYRRADSGGHAGRLYEHLTRYLGTDAVFMDIDDIPAGADFVQVIESKLAQCDTVLVLIGPHWATISDAQGRRRLHDPGDFVRLEVQRALAMNKRVIPVLIDGTPMPGAADLPPDLQPLLRRNAVEISNPRFAYDVEHLAQALTGQPVTSRPAEAFVSPPDLKPPPAARYPLLDSRRQARYTKTWIVLNILMVAWAIAALVIEYDAFEDDGDFVLIEWTYLAIWPGMLVLLSLIQPIRPRVAILFVFVLHGLYGAVMWSIPGSTGDGTSNICWAVPFTIFYALVIWFSASVRHWWSRLSSQT